MPTTPHPSRDCLRHTDLRNTTTADPLARAIEDRLSDIDSYRYTEQSEYVLKQFADFYRRSTDNEEATVEEVTVANLRAYARALKRSVDDGHLTPNSANQYWSVVSAFLSWAVREELLDTNPALLNAAREPLPEQQGTAEQQFWSERERKAICMLATTAVDEVTSQDEYTDQALLNAYRDRAFIYALAYSGCRGAELLSVPSDDERTGIRWEDVSLSDGVITVYGKSREYETAPLLEPAIQPLKRYYDELSPPDEWPVFPTTHLPSLYPLLDDMAVEPDSHTIWRQLIDAGKTPPPLTTRAGRSLIHTLCEREEYEFDEALTLHGARRGLGHQLYREDSELAQDVLRHKDISVTHDAYRNEKATDIKQRADEIVD